MRKADVSEKITDFKGLFKAFFSPDDEIVKVDSEEEINFKREYSKILSQTKSDIDSLEANFKYPDLKVREKAKKTGRTKQELKTKGTTLETNKNQIVHKEDREIER